ncbi:hypothetical protein BDY17DRAFT_323813 [Neohortaea acidophila]|uniref:Zn(2)-C6 fungal-type domain-containing protein n=1 Tax=Neohortaea acidophila TaxID=245834 RepID=A0A6A6PSH1_9PEZI|nr:uncharacterized protein BDY17DRAFT_323813 [Neohortaea acidophila]KAF2483048.1 hypothetical protein BDY17DRAFT_323813 [Neohortaea acidophila]
MDEDETTTANTTRARSTYPRRRAVNACNACRARRTKCDNRRPKCSFCERTGAACLRSTTDFSSFDPASLEILDRLSRIEKALLPPALSSPHPSHLREVVAEGYDSYMSNPEVDIDLFPQTLPKILAWPVLRPFTSPNWPVDVIYSPVASGNSASHPMAFPIETIADIDMKTCMALVDDYFNYNHIKNPIFDENAVRSTVKRVCFEGFARDADSCLTLLVLASGAISSPFDRELAPNGPSDTTLADALFDAAQKRVGFIFGQGNLLQAQCFFASGVFLMCKFRAYDAWKMFLQALAACQSFVCAGTPGTGPVDESNNESVLSERVYWSAWKSEREVRFELGLRDFGVSDLSHPGLYLTLPQGGVEGPSLRSWYFYLSETAIWRLRVAARKAMMERAASHASFDVTTLVPLSAHLEEQVVAWQESLTPSIALGDLSRAAEETDILKYVLRGAITNYYEMITWPFVVAAIHTEGQSQRVLECATKGLEWHMNRLIINLPGFHHRHHGTWLMQQSSSRSALILCAAALTAQTSRLLPPGWMRAVERVGEMLRYWSPCVPTASDRAEVLEALLARVGATTVDYT